MDNVLLTNIAWGICLAVFRIGLGVFVLIVGRALVVRHQDRPWIIPGWILLVAAIVSLCGFTPQESSGALGGEWAVATDVTFFTTVITAATLAIRAACRRTQRSHPTPASGTGLGHEHPRGRW